MTGSWNLIARGLAIAVLGASATALYIVSVSCLYVGRFSFGLGALVTALLGAALFRSCLGPYLNALEAHTNADLTNETRASSDSV